MKINFQMMNALVDLANSKNNARKYEQFFHASLVAGLESGRVIKCWYTYCGRYSLATKAGRKKFCTDQCRWDANNGRVRKI